MRFRVERHHRGAWELVAEEVHAHGPHAPSVAVGRVAHDPGIYRVAHLDTDGRHHFFEVPGYGLPVPIPGSPA